MTTPKQRVKAAAKQLVDTELLSHVSPLGQQQLGELRAQLLEAVKLSPAERIRNVAHALDELQPLMTSHGRELVLSIRGVLADAANELEDDE